MQHGKTPLRRPLRLSLRFFSGVCCNRLQQRFLHLFGLDKVARLKMGIPVRHLLAPVPRYRLRLLYRQPAFQQFSVEKMSPSVKVQFPFRNLFFGYPDVYQRLVEFDVLLKLNLPFLPMAYKV
jgi:hypothetical protein